MSLFDGMAGILNDVFGAPVTHTPAGGSPVTLQAIFRREPITTVDREGFEALVVSPTLQVPLPQANDVQRGDTVVPGDGQPYRIINRHPSGSPAGDAFVVFELERIS
jgi:hypothetical protein